ncbi:uncharacterized protein FOMMEDRAFT_154409 [Fomitiporia mediterranea MF3/22]|uniref:uncharacterized protein n=1 Tax=Fomitiporia mediterranea (strain MF3/22) TaxID=694068 RepID=UPI0004409371|nr:uncharacterized protein FOMMEDRAFT_154409 [Fomitiporia mediterranea MF3/22]EJD05194.1 hypothetical protein FOMMEDRAFT_154409 [Fomitiporia mediterranea MF3/22]
MDCDFFHRTVSVLYGSLEGRPTEKDQDPDALLKSQPVKHTGHHRVNGKRLHSVLHHLPPRIFSVCLLGAILVFIAERAVGAHALSFAFHFFGPNAYHTIVITVMTTLAPKMLINLRAEYYGPVGIIATELSWDAQTFQPASCQ